MTATKYGYSTAEAQKLDASHDYFNQALFGGSLAPCRIQITSNGNGKWAGLFIRNGAMNGDQPIDQIKIDEDYFSQYLKQNDLRQVMSTLVHEMAHQAHPSKGHGKAWRKCMEEIGLPPIQLKKGCWRSADHTIEPNGWFDAAFRAMSPDLKQGWSTFVVPDKPKPTNNRFKMACPVCGDSGYFSKEVAITCAGDLHAPAFWVRPTLGMLV